MIFGLLRSKKKTPHTKAAARTFLSPQANIPDISACISLMNEHGMLDNIRHHSLVVARIADALSIELLDDPVTAFAPERSLILAGALLHDIAKTPCLDKDCDHAAAGGEICRKKGYPEVAAIVEEHVLLKDHNQSHYNSGYFKAREIVYYADKRVRHNQIVSLDERLEYIQDKYGNNDPKRHRLIRENFQHCQELEQALFKYLPFKAIDLEHHIRFPRLPDKMLNNPWA